MHMLWYQSSPTPKPKSVIIIMSISSLNTQLLSQNSTLSSLSSSNANLQSLGTALGGGDLASAKNIFSAISQNSSSSMPDVTTQTLMGQLSDALNGGSVSQAQQITTALQTLQNQAVSSNPLLSDASSGSTNSGLNNSLFSALSMTDSNSGGATSLAGIASVSAAGLVSPAQEIAQNMDNFLSNLLTKLQSQGTTASGSSSSNLSGKQNPYGPTASNQMSSGLQNLIEQLAKNPTAASELNTSGTTSTSVHPPTDPQVSELQSSYDKLISSQGGSGGTSSLISFLQNFETNMKNMQSTGGLLNLQA